MQNQRWQFLYYLRNNEVFKAADVEDRDIAVCE